MKMSLVGLCAAALLVSNASAETINVKAWGITWEQGLQEIADAFTKETGIKVNPIPQTSSTEGLVQISQNRANPNVDVWFTTSSVAARAQNDTELFAKIDLDALTNKDDIISSGISENWVGAYYYPLNVVYRGDAVDAPITKWEDLWNEGYKNNIAAPAFEMYQGRLLVLASVLNGGDITNIDPGFDALKRLAPNVSVWFPSDSDARKAIATGEVDILVATPVFKEALAEDVDNLQMVIPAPTPITYDVMMLVNTPKKDSATKFIDYVLNKDAQEKLAAGHFSVPVNRKAQAPEEISGLMPAEDQLISIDEVILNEHADEWSRRFHSEIAK
ncbi:extracellular solute-binding protein [Castellaniella sp.]|uniref:extracellular solute-binding protein n=1 Tax=Castellaniella sp. TaxID=1955812 RepID=UPI00355E588F